MGRADDAHVDAPRTWRADGLHLARLERTQELHLQRQGKIADFVEEQRPTVRDTECAQAGGDGSGERASLVSEQLRLGQLGRDRAAVHRDEGGARAGRKVVHCSRGKLLATATFSADEHG